VLQASASLGENSLIIITFDEGGSSDYSTCCGLTTSGGHVATILISPKAKPTFRDNTPYNHYSLLKTILAAWNLPALGNTAEPAIQPIEAPWSGN
jgi:phosphatidylinositol-3-phosphatase